MHETKGFGSPQVHPAVSLARQNAMMKSLLREIQQAMIEDQGEAHPWIAGAKCPPLLAKIKECLNAENAGS